MQPEKPWIMVLDRFFFQCGHLITTRPWAAAIGFLLSLGEYPDSHLYIFATSFFLLLSSARPCLAQFSAATVGMSVLLKMFKVSSQNCGIC